MTGLESFGGRELETRRHALCESRVVFLAGVSAEKAVALLFRTPRHGSIGLKQLGS